MSGCSSSNPTGNTGLTYSKTYTVYDNAGNKSEPCGVYVSSYQLGTLYPGYCRSYGTRANCGSWGIRLCTDSGWYTSSSACSNANVSSDTLKRSCSWSGACRCCEQSRSCSYESYCAIWQSDYYAAPYYTYYR